jgi:hypothetical protein
LVLFDLLFDFKDEPALVIRNNAGRAALWALCCYLEKTLAEPFLPEYGELLDEARKQVAAQASGEEG